MEELRQKIIQAMQADFIGDVIFDDEEIEHMKTDCRKFYRTAQQSWSKTYHGFDICELIVLIVNIAKTWNVESEGRFWIKLFTEIFDDSSVSPVKFYNEFEPCLKQYGKALFRSKENKRMFKEVFLLHAFAPNASSESFIRLLWSWFSDSDVINFDYQPGDPIYEQIAKFLQLKFAGEADLDEDVTFEGKTYAIKASFKYLFTQDNATGIKLLNKVFEYFDDAYFNGTYDNTSYFAQICFENIEKILRESNQKTQRRKRARSEHIISDYSKISAAYEIDDNGAASLFIPEIRAIDETANDYIIELYNDNALIYRDEGYIVGSNLKRRIKRITIPFETFIKRFEEELTLEVRLLVVRDEDEVEIYNSQKSLYRDFILIKSNREIRLEYCKPDSYYILHPLSFNLQKFTNCSIADLNNYTAVINAQEDEYITTASRQIFFNQKPKSSHYILEGKRSSNLSYIENEIEYPLYKKMASCTVILDSTTKSESIVITDETGKHYPLSSCSTQDGNNYKLDIKKLKLDMPGLHELKIADVSKKKLLQSIYYFIHEALNAQLSGANYIFNYNKTLLVAREYGEDILSYLPKNGDEYIDIDFGNGIIRCALPYIKWRIDDNEWQYSALRNTLWHKDAPLHNNCVLEIENASDNDISIQIDSVAVAQTKDGKYLLGDALIENSVNDECEVSIKIGNNSQALLTIANKESLSDFDIDIEEETIDFTNYFVGDGNARFLVEMSGEYGEYSFECGLSGAFDFDIVDGDYEVNIYLLNFLGDKTMLLSEEYSLGNPFKVLFNNADIVLLKFNPVGMSKIKLDNAVITELRFLREEGSTNVFSGMLIDKRKRFPVEVYVKDYNSLAFYFVKNEELLPIGYSLSTRTFTDAPIDGKAIIACASCYYDTKEN